MRGLIVTRLRGDYPEARIIHELPLRYSSNRIDLAAVTRNAIISVEIKSSRDEMRRLERQVRAFLPISSRVIVALAPKWLSASDKPKSRRRRKRRPALPSARDILSHVGGRVETWSVCATTATVEEINGGWRDQAAPWSSQLLDMLWRAELEVIANQHEIAIAKRRPSHAILRDACEAGMTGHQIRAAVCAVLRARVAFGKASDAAIQIAA